MSGSTDLAVRRTGTRIETAHPSGALTLRSDQTRFDEQQRAALATLGIKTDAPQADLDVFLHVSQRMGLDPFAKQIHLIYYRVNEAVWNPRTRQWDDNWIEKPSIQTGIGGFRVQRDRVAKREGLLIDYEDTVWYNAKGEGFDVWLWDEPPAACRVVTKISDGRRFPATIRFNEFAKRNKNGQLTGRWRDGHSYQIEKCAEAASLRKAFPQDFAGLDLDVEIESDPDAPAVLPQDQPQRQRVTAEQAKANAPQRATAEVISVIPDVPPAGEQPAPPAAASEAPADPAGGTPGPEHKSLQTIVTAQLTRILGGDVAPVTASAWAARILRQAEALPLAELTAAELQTAVDVLGKCGSRAELEALLKSGEVPGGE
jgi:phage recombination protein Bet